MLLDNNDLPWVRGVLEHHVIQLNPAMNQDNILSNRSGFLVSPSPLRAEQLISP